MCVSRCLTCFLGDMEGPLLGAHGSAAACAEAGNPLNPNKQATRREGKKEDKPGVKTRVHEPENDLMEEHPEGSQKGPAGSWKQPRAIREQVWDSTGVLQGPGALGGGLRPSWQALWLAQVTLMPGEAAACPAIGLGQL